MIEKGIDPGDTKKAQKAAETQETETFEVIAREWHDKFSSSWAQSHGSKIIRRLELYVFPWLGNRTIRSITAPELLSVLLSIESKGTLETAHRTQQNCGQVFRHLAPLVFVRPGELRHAEWSEINFDSAEWRIPAEKMKSGVQHIVPSSRQALDILREIQSLTGHGWYVFPSPRTNKRPMSSNAVLSALRRMR